VRVKGGKGFYSESPGGRQAFTDGPRAYSDGSLSRSGGTGGAGKGRGKGGGKKSGKGKRCGHGKGAPINSNAHFTAMQAMHAMQAMQAMQHTMPHWLPPVPFQAGPLQSALFQSAMPPPPPPVKVAPRKEGESHCLFFSLQGLLPTRVQYYVLCMYCLL
jgi:hypothetical protein